MPPEDDPLENLQHRVYGNAAQRMAEVPAYSHEDVPQTYGWQAPPPPPPQAPVKKHMSWAAKFLIAAGVFLVLAAAGAAYLLFFGGRAISSDNVTVQIDTPVSIASGDTVPVIIRIHNSNPAALTGASLLVTLPSGTRAGDGTDAALTQYSDALGDIPAGGDITRTVQAKLFGSEGAQLSIAAKVEYKTEGSNALFVSNGDHAVVVSSSPISVQVQSLSQTASGQPLTLNVLVRSNASAPVTGLALTAQYPSGFSPQSAQPAPTAANYFMLGTLEPGEQKVIKITGTLTGQNAEQRVFRFIAGSANPDGTSTLGNNYAEGDATIAITHPFLNVGLSLNQENADSVVAPAGSAISGFLSYENTLTDTLANATIRVALSGNALDVSSISGGTGFYRSTDGSVIFDSTTNPGLAALAGGASGAGSFSFSLKQAAALTSVTNPTVTLTVSVTGQQSAASGAPQSLSSTLTRTVKVGTNVTLASSISRTGAFTTSGPIPPVPGQETTYDVTLVAKNTVNSVGAAKVSMQLPSYVRYTNTADKSVTYNADNRTVTWTVGDLAPNATSQATFQIGFTPSTSQSGSAATLVGLQSFTGVDRFTQAQVTVNATELNTELPGSKGSGTVQ